MTSPSQHESSPARGRYLHAVLTVIAALLALHLLRGTTGGPQGETALAQRVMPPDAYGVPNAAEQRSRMIKVLEELGAKFDSLERRLDKGGFEVKVTSMPKVELAQ